ncbi:tetratricopeptide repeat protein [Kordiimonas aestuarii]|uniref:tetratricopeptide repeat protein n=1 Tax=Kordiimonas aestuarii TaxID=1005925 RepID=UPI0021D19F7E|nr:tetratricopeptide repeat protein [Kordiimonas aestuarii]
MIAQADQVGRANQRARAAAGQRDWVTAAEMWALWRQENPADAEGYLGGMAALRGQMDSGMEKEACAKAFRSFALAVTGVSVEDHIRMGDFARHLKDWNTAARIYAAVRAKWPGRPEPYIAEARCLEKLGQYDQAFYVLSLKLRTGDPAFRDKARGLLAECFRQIGQNRYRHMVDGVAHDPARYSGAKVVLLMYADGEPYRSTARKLKDSFLKLCRFDCEVRILDQVAIQKRPWFAELERCKNNPEQIGSRGGFYNAWKAYIVRDTLRDVSEGDMVYYVDASRHFLLGFYEDINSLFRLQHDHDETLFAGAFNARLSHGIGWMGDRPELYDALGLAQEYDTYMAYPARLNSSFLLKKNAATMAFAEEWALHAVYETISLHHTADQAIFSALAYKYGFYGYNIQADSVAQFLEDSPHVWAKDPNVVHRMVNSCVPYYELFRDPRRPEFWPGNLAICV